MKYEFDEFKGSPVEILLLSGYRVAGLVVKATETCVWVGDPVEPEGKPARIPFAVIAVYWLGQRVK